MNYMPEVLEMLNLEVGEKFNIKGIGCDGVFFDEEHHITLKNTFLNEDSVLYCLIRGIYEIEKLPYKPKYNEVYYIVNSFGEITQCRWLKCNSNQYYRYNAGNCFRTKEEITEEIKQRILSEMKGKYEND